jgi:UDP-N-acetylglucosamine 2-epimerase
MAPVVHELRKRSAAFDLRVVFTGQHEAMLDQAMAVFNVREDIRLSVMQANQSLASLTGKLLAGIDECLVGESPDWVLAQGDTTTVMAASLACFYRRIRFGHVEAGLRTGVLSNPFPEEANRRIADLFSAYHFAPTRQNAAILLREGYPADHILVTGNTVVDALHFAARIPYDKEHGPLAALPKNRRIVAITLHRRESWGAPLRSMCDAIRELARCTAAEGVSFVFPVHLNPQVREPVRQELGREPNILLVDPLDYRSFVCLLQEACLIMTDSGGIQEEAPSFGVPALVLRETTERPEAVEAGTAKLVGTRKEDIVREALPLLRNENLRKDMIRRGNPFGDGRAALRIADALEGNDVEPFSPVSP